MKEEREKAFETKKYNLRPFKFSISSIHGR
jgi:hypothetical protein